MLKYLQEPPKRYLFDGCKLLWHQDRLQQWLEDRKIMPIHIDMGIHKWCNIKCVYCYGMKQVPSREYIREEALMALANDASEVGVRSIAIIGDGEPTLNPGLYPFVKICYLLGVDVAVATNGLLLNEDKLETLIWNCKWIRFNVSAVGDMYQHTMGTNKTIEDFENVVLRAVALNKINMYKPCTIGLQMVLIPQCFDQIVLLARKAVDWGVDYLVIKQYSDPEEGIPINVDLKEYKYAEERLKEAEAMSNNRTKIIVKWHAMSDSKSITVDKKWGFEKCIDLPFIFQISGDGGCYPCGYLFGNPSYCYGNVNKMRLKDILYSKRYWEIIRRVADMPLLKLCRGQCRHCETNKFVDELKREYKGNLKEALVKMCGGESNYNALVKYPPEHVSFI